VVETTAEAEEEGEYEYLREGQSGHTMQTELGGESLATLVEARRELPSDGRSYEAWTKAELATEMEARRLPPQPASALKKDLIADLRRADRDDDAAERAACPDCREVERVLREGGSAHCDRHRTGAHVSGKGRGRGRGGAASSSPSTSSSPEPSAPPAAAIFEADLRAAADAADRAAERSGLGFGAFGPSGDGRGCWRVHCSGCGQINPGHRGRDCAGPDLSTRGRAPTRPQIAYVETLCSRRGLERPPLETWDRLQVSRWLMSVTGDGRPSRLPGAAAGPAGTLCIF